MFMLSRILRELIVEGELTVIDAGGKKHHFKGSIDGPSVTIHFHDRVLPFRALFAPSMALGEGYMDGRLTIEDGGSIYDFLALVARNLEKVGDHPLHSFSERLSMMFRRLHQYNPVHRSKENVAHHYDLSGELYDLFLDQDKQYSCAYFESPGDDIDTAQTNKRRHIAAKLRLDKGQKVLDIGCGWGGMGLYIAQESGAEVTGITLSEEQHKIANERAEKLGLTDRAQFNLQDYRHQTGTFDRIVSVGMFEHVGVGHFREFFGKVHEVLADDGVMLLHTIGRSGPPSVTDAWIRKYIFPGGYIPALSEVMPTIERAGLVATDIEFLGPHYAETLKAWRERFVEKWDEAAKLYDEKFCRMWEFYLAGSEISFRYMGMTVFQIQLCKHRSAVPLTRNYISEWEDAHRKSTARDERAA